MCEWRTAGDFRQRTRKADRATARLGEQLRKRCSARTYEAIADFEETLKAAQEASLRAYDEIPDEAEGALPTKAPLSALAGSRASAIASGAASAAAGPSSTTAPAASGAMNRSSSDPGTAPPHTRRPPSPMGMYDYGSVSSKPRSVFAQHKQQLGLGKKEHETACGFYFPGSQYKHGPYGFSLQDPCLMPPRIWSHNKPPPTRYLDDSGDMRPLMMQTLGPRGRRVDADEEPVVPKGVNSTTSHTLRARRTFHGLRWQRDEGVLEQVRFENGVFRGSFRDPLLDTGGGAADTAGGRSKVPVEFLPPRPSPEEWLSIPAEDMTPLQRTALTIVVSLEFLIRSSHARLKDLFNFENQGGVKTVLEPEQFLRGLVRRGIVDENSMTREGIIGVLNVIDPRFEGHVNLPTLDKAIVAVRNMQGQHMKASEQLHQKLQSNLATSYSEMLPVEVVKVERDARSLLNFERSFDRFRTQQRDLLSQHRESAH